MDEDCHDRIPAEEVTPDSLEPEDLTMPSSTLAPMTVKEILAKLESMGDDARRKHNAKVGPDGTVAPDNQFGVKHGDIRALAKKIKPPKGADNRDLALQLWATGNVEAQLLATLLIKPASLSAKELDAMTRSTTCASVAEWLNSYVVAQHPERESLRETWMKPKEKHRWAARAGWHLTASMINKGEGGLDVEALLDRIEKEMPKAPPETQWTMNNTLMAIGIHHAKHRKLAIAIGEKIGLYKDWPMSKGCIIPYVPVCVPELVKRQA
ncbi:MAG: DNA alkylation repair protein [Phycisphaerae bacterium]|nr:DNA alkylation repair protein [Phycisphaerae bacterium]